MNTRNDTTETTATTSEESVSEIAEAAAKVASLSADFNWWTNWGLGLTLAAAIVAGAYWLVSQKANKVGHDLETAQEELVAAKDRQLERELKAGSERTANLENENLLLRQRLIETEEAAIPRSIVWSEDIGRQLGQFSNVPLAIEFMVSDSEAERLAMYLRSALDASGWQPSLTRVVAGMAEGISVGGRPNSEDRTLWTDEVKSAETAADSLNEYLLANGIQSTRTPVSQRATPGSVLVRIGSKPRPYLKLRSIESFLSEDEKAKQWAEYDAMIESQRTQMESLRRKWRMPPYTSQ